MPESTSYSTRHATIARHSKQPGGHFGPCGGQGRIGGTRERSRRTRTPASALRASRTSRTRRARSRARGRRPAGSGGQLHRPQWSARLFSTEPPSASGGMPRSRHIQDTPRTPAGKCRCGSEAAQPSNRRPPAAPPCRSSRRPGNGALPPLAAVREGPTRAEPSASASPLGERFPALPAPLPDRRQAAPGRPVFLRPTSQRRPRGAVRVEPRKRAVAAFSGRPGRTGHYSARFRGLTTWWASGLFGGHVGPPRKDPRRVPRTCRESLGTALFRGQGRLTHYPSHHDRGQQNRDRTDR
jgi:hypothetical protein